MFFVKLPLNSLNNLPFRAFLLNNLRKKYISGGFFSSLLSEWYDLNKRDLPWRHTNNPYIIWLSEVILQQTRVDQGLPYFKVFVDNYPNVQLLAAVPEDELFKHWQGLGYYNRARNLHATAKIIVEKFNGFFPTVYEDVIELKGVGDYTAAAIMSFAYNKPYATVDGNVYRVLSRIFGLEEFIDTSAGKKEFQALALDLLDKDNPGLFNQALMEFGALQCVPSSPNCDVCPFQEKCHAFNLNQISLLPRKRGKVSVRNRFFNYLDIRVDGKVLLKKRTNKDIWRGLYEFPLIETEKEISLEELAKTKCYKEMFLGVKEVKVIRELSLRHVLSHQIINARFYKLDLAHMDLKGYSYIKDEEISVYPVSKMIDNYLESE